MKTYESKLFLAEHPPKIMDAPIDENPLVKPKEENDQRNEKDAPTPVSIFTSAKNVLNLGRL